jgi:hypothetical protein
VQNNEATKPRRGSVPAGVVGSEVSQKREEKEIKKPANTAILMLSDGLFIMQ